VFLEENKSGFKYHDKQQNKWTKKSNWNPRNQNRF
jgi:hypothetical protein